MSGKTKVFEIGSLTHHRRFVDQLTYITSGISVASHAYQVYDNKWFQYNGNKWIECEEPEIVDSIEELNVQQL